MSNKRREDRVLMVPSSGSPMAFSTIGSNFQTANQSISKAQRISSDFLQET